MSDLLEIEEDVFDRPLVKNIPLFVSNPIKFVNTALFSETANFYTRNKCYTQAPKGTLAYKQFWDEEVRRCRRGYTVGGVTITGRHYFYLNYFRIKKFKEGSRNKKEYGFPSFFDMDYYYFHEIDLCLMEGLGLCVAKARRKGFSYKNAAIGLYEYVFERESTVVVGAYLDEYAQTTTEMISYCNDFLMGITPFGRMKIIDRADYFMSGYEENKVKKGFGSEVYTLSFRNNFSASIGKSCSIFLWEEAGKFPNLIQSYEFTRDTLMDGAMSVGCNLIFGTGGDMESGASEGFEEMFYNPHKYGLRAYASEHYDTEDPNPCSGYLVNDLWMMRPYFDADGNSDIVTARRKNLADRAIKMKDAKNTKGLDNYMTQHPLTASEAFLIAVGSYFDNALLMKQLNNLLTNKKLATFGEKGTLEPFKDSAKWKPDGSLMEAAFPFDPKNMKGCIVIYEHPELMNGVVPSGLYLASTDPYMHDEAKTSDSLGSTFIYKKFFKQGSSYDCIVAEYTGRPETSDEYYENVRLLLLYYDARCLYENQFKDMKVYFEKMGCLYLLARQPSIIKDIIPTTVVNRGYGIHMPLEMKQFGINKLRAWFKKDRGDGRTNTDEIMSIYVIKEALKFNMKVGNFDRISSLLILMIYIEETYKVIVENNEENSREGFFDRLFENTYNKRR